MIIDSLYDFRGKGQLLCKYFIKKKKVEATFIVYHGLLIVFVASFFTGHRILCL